jgi:hypothetical protein
MGLVDLKVAGAGDVNGDGLRDVVLGAHFAGSDEAGSPGRAWIVFGRRGGGRTVALARPGRAAVRFDGVGCDSAGASVAGAGDVNADGLADVAIGAPQDCHPGRHPGGVIYVVHGSRRLRGGALPTVVRRAGLRIDGIDDGNIGHSVARLGDHDGDGRDDLLIGDAGSALVVLSPRGAGPRAVALHRVGRRALRVLGPRGDSSFGETLASVADIDGDGRRELLIGATQATHRRVPAVGAVRLVFSRALRARGR